MYTSIGENYKSNKIDKSASLGLYLFKIFIFDYRYTILEC